MLSTHPKPIYGVTKDDNKKKPAVIKLYDFTKGGLDIVDHRIGSFTVKAKTKHWPMCAFSFLLDTARVNAQTVRSLNNGLSPRLSKSFQLIYHMAKDMIMPLIYRRLENPYGLSDLMIATMRKMTKESLVSTPPVKNDIKQRYKAYQADCITTMMKYKDFLGPSPMSSLSSVRIPNPKNVLCTSRMLTPRRSLAMKHCKACHRETAGKVRAKNLYRSKYMCEICEEAVCLKTHGYFRCPECNKL